MADKIRVFGYTDSDPEMRAIVSQVIRSIVRLVVGLQLEVEFTTNDQPEPANKKAEKRVVLPMLKLSEATRRSLVDKLAKVLGIERGNIQFSDQ